MKISGADKIKIQNKIHLTLATALTASLDNPQELLTNVYKAWYADKVTPYVQSPLLKLFPDHTTLETRLLDNVAHSLKLQRYKLGTENQYSNPLDLVDVTEVGKTDLNVNQLLIATDSSRWNNSITISLQHYAAEYAAVQKYKTQFDAGVEANKLEIRKLSIALDTVNTYKQLEIQMPVIFNSLPQETQAKYDAYKAKQRANRGKKREQAQIEADFTDLGTALAIEAIRAPEKQV